MAALTEEAGREPAGRTVLIAVGRKLHSVLQNGPHRGEDIHYVDGAGVADEATSALNRIVDQIDSLQRKHGALRVSSLYHGSEGEMRSRDLLPTFQNHDTSAGEFSHPPLLNLDPAELLVALGDHYLFSVLFEIIHDSLRSENLHRVTHLSDAVRHLDDRTADLARRANALRQEEITEEIEVILLSASSLETTTPRS